MNSFSSIGFIMAPYFNFWRLDLAFSLVYTSVFQFKAISVKFQILILHIVLLFQPSRSCEVYQQKFCFHLNFLSFCYGIFGCCWSENLLALVHCPRFATLGRYQVSGANRQPWVQMATCKLQSRKLHPRHHQPNATTSST